MANFNNESNVNDLWESLRCERKESRRNALAESILKALDIEVEQGARVTGRNDLNGVPQPLEGLTQVTVPRPAFLDSGAYIYDDGRHRQRALVGCSRQGGPLIFVCCDNWKDSRLTTGEEMFRYRVYGPPGAWFQWEDSGSGNKGGSLFVLAKS